MMLVVYVTSVVRFPLATLLPLCSSNAKIVAGALRAGAARIDQQQSFVEGGGSQGSSLVAQRNVLHVTRLQGGGGAASERG